MDYAARYFLIGVGACVLFATAVNASTPESDCTRIEQASDRLACYDRAHAKPAQSMSSESHDGTGAPDASIFEKRWEQDAARKTFEPTAYRPSYVLPIFYNTSPNNVPYASDPDADLDHNEIKFQISLQLKVDNNFLGSSGDLWFSYTQQSWWQAYNKDISSPFRETNYEPEFYWSTLTDYSVFGMRGRQLNIGVVHQSNGQSDALSRSWNRVYASIGLERDNFSLIIKPWVRIPENDNSDDNPDIIDYMGHGEVWGFYKYDNHLFALMLRNIENLDQGGAEFDWSFPISRHLRGLVQVYNGYGESLIDYNHSSHRIGVGLLLSDWL